MEWLHSITNGLTILIGIFLIFSLFSNAVNAKSFPGKAFQYASGQPGNTASKSKSDDRIVLAPDDARKLRQVPGERGENQYIVVLKGNNVQSSGVRSVSNESRNEGPILRHLYYHAIKGFSIRVPNDRVLNAILKNPRVDYV